MNSYDSITTFKRTMASVADKSCGMTTADTGDSDIENRTFEASTLACLFEDLRALAYEARHIMPKRETQRQYIICGLFSEAEIESSGKYKSKIKRFSHYLLGLGEKDKNEWKFGSKFICKGRMAVIMNSFGRHGEARLLDPEGTLLGQIDSSATDNEPDTIERNPRHYLDSMKKQFVREFGADVDQYIVLLSHLIPCTEPGHQCARLIREYAEQTQSYFIISYDNGYERTNTRKALEHLTHENICVVKPRERRGIVNKQVRQNFGDCRELKRLTSTEYHDEDELVDELDLLEGPTTTKKSRNKDRATRKGCRTDDSKKKRKGFSRQNSEDEWKRSW